MKITRLLILLGLVCLSFDRASAQTEKQIRQIRREVISIEKNAKNYRKMKSSVEGISLEGAEATFYVSGKNLRKIAAKLYGETYNADVSLYYRGEDLIFAYLKQNKYDRSINLETIPKIVQSERARYYFADKLLIRLTVGNSKIKEDTQKYTEMRDEMSETANKLKAAFEEKQNENRRF